MIDIENASKRVNLRHQRLWLLPQKAIYWQKKKILLIADPHLGKAGHFRRHGIPVPGKVNATNLQLLEQLIELLDIQHLVILGDLFHSKHNREWEQFFDWRADHAETEVTLVIGNHDILKSDTYHASRINLFHKLRIEPFLLVHDLNSVSIQQEEDHYLLSGHIHPAVQLRGKGRQSMKLPCFYFGQGQGILPAFGEFTGTHVIKPDQGDRVYAVVQEQVLNLSQ